MYKETINLPKTDFPMKGNLPTKELEIQARWERMGVYEETLKAPCPGGAFVFHDGPPYSNENIHLGHALNKILKDIVCRYKRMRGYRVKFIPGWDNHGLPIEREITQRYPGLSYKEVRNRCRGFAARFVEVQRAQFIRLGVRADWKNAYLTMSKEYEASVLKVFSKLVEKGYIYRGLRPIHWCTQCRTALALAEIEYAEKESYSLWIRFPMKEDPGGIFALDGKPLPKERCYALVWTTTPWTIPANLALAFHPEHSYVITEVAGEYYLLAEDLLTPNFGELGFTGYRVLKTVKGSQIEGTMFTHPIFGRDSAGILGDFVTLDQGTGVVHVAPGHGKEDFEAGVKYGLRALCPVDEEGKFTEEAAQFAGMTLAAGDQAVIDELRNRRNLLKLDRVAHSYPHCWRCKTPLVFRTTTQWFMNVDHEGHRGRALAAIGGVRWVPKESLNRISSAVETRPDWCLSRQKAWGVGIPAFYCEECGEALLRADLIERVAHKVGEHGSDIWYDLPAQEFLPGDFSCPKCKSKNFKKETDILDVWFDSGASHLVVLKDDERPCDLYLEGSDQHRGWFNTSLMIGIGVNNEPPYKTVVTSGWVLDAEGKAMHKSLGNVISPLDVIEKDGADVLRLWVSSSNYFSDVKISEEILERVRDAYKKIRYTLKFLLGNLYDFDPAADLVPYEERCEIDRWVLHKLSDLIEKAEAACEDYEFHRVYHLIYQFCVVDLSAFYIDVLKDTLYVSLPSSAKRRSAQSSIYEVVKALMKLLSPITPHTAEEAWINLPGEKEKACELSLFPDGMRYLDRGTFVKWEQLLKVRADVLYALEKKREEKVIGNSLEAKVILHPHSEELRKLLLQYEEDLSMLFITSQVEIAAREEPHRQDFHSSTELNLDVEVRRAEGEKCARCWLYFVDVGENEKHPHLCRRCSEVIVRREGGG